jgi:NADPH:quinone reductase-like Zn-dependent oxidoreductase
MSGSHNAIATTARGAIGIISVPTLSPSQQQLRIKVDSAALTPFHLYQIDAGLFVLEYPQRLGITGAGTVVELGEGVKDYTIGDKVAFIGFQPGPESTLQQFVTTSVYNVGKIPHELSFEEASTIPDNFVTAWFAISNSLGLPLTLTPVPHGVSSANPNASEPILIYGSGSSSGQFAIQVLHAKGYTNIFTTASPKHHKDLHALGATNTFDYNSSHLTDEILALTKGEKIKLVLDCVGNKESLGKIKGVVGKGSKVAVLMPVKDGKDVVSGNLLNEIPKEWNAFEDGVEVIAVRTLFYHQNEDLRQNLMPKTFTSMLAENSLKPNQVIVKNEGDLEKRAKDAFDLLRSGSVSGKRVVVKIGDA